MTRARDPGRFQTQPGTITEHTQDLTNHVNPLANSNMHIPLPWTPPDPSPFKNTKCIVFLYLTDHTDP